MTNERDVTALLNKAQEGDKPSLDKLFPLVYDELRRVAARQLRAERSDHTLQATALVHEAYIRLLEQKEVDWENRLHFFSIASEMIRRILVNYAVKRNAKKRGQNATKLALDEAVNYSTGEEFDVVGLDAALRELAEFDEKQAKIVELRFFGGLTIEETAEVLEISDSTVKREWRMAKSWLRSRI
ncbi:MAG: sigma-70 family RNA polymerase sigma factor [Pyrinomonadaceae bacterium]|nr:sigma-70 family RNA polymerase sigma factor [Pyrinomonadaceae bacterium]